MSPYEILMPEDNEHFNDETGKVWLERVIARVKSLDKPNPEEYWESYHRLK